MKACSHSAEDCVCPNQMAKIGCPYSYDEMEETKPVSKTPDEIIDDMHQKAINLVLYGTRDPTAPNPFGAPGNLPAMTVLLFKVCKDDPELFAEACRLVELFIDEAITQTANQWSQDR